MWEKKVCVVNSVATKHSRDEGASCSSLIVVLPFQHVTRGGRGYGGRATADRPQWILPEPAESPESLAGRRCLQ